MRFQTSAMRAFAAWVGLVSLGTAFMIGTGTESCGGRTDQDPRTIPVETEHYSGGGSSSSSGYSGGHSSWSSGGSSSSFGK